MNGVWVEEVGPYTTYFLTTESGSANYLVNSYDSSFQFLFIIFAHYYDVDGT